MIKIENIEVYNFDGAIRGCRNALQSWNKIDSYPAELTEDGQFHIGENDLSLLKRLYKAGRSDRKFMRQIFVSMDIVAPVYWLAELKTYQIGTTINSTSLMHTGTKRDFTIDDFSFEDISGYQNGMYFEDKLFKEFDQVIVDIVNFYRQKYVETKDARCFRAMRQIMPMGYNYRITWSANYEVCASIINQRKNHRLSEWKEFCSILLRKLPYLEEIMGEG